MDIRDLPKGERESMKLQDLPADQI